MGLGLTAGERPFADAALKIKEASVRWQTGLIGSR